MQALQTRSWSNVMGKTLITALFFINVASADDVYRAGVQAYLDGNNETAISYLEEAIRQNISADKAKQLLLKVYVRTIRYHSERKEIEKTRRLIEQSGQFLPQNPEIQSLSLSIPSVPKISQQAPTAADSASPELSQKPVPSKSDELKKAALIETKRPPTPSDSKSTAASSHRNDIIKAPQRLQADKPLQSPLKSGPNKDAKDSTPHREPPTSIAKTHPVSINFSRLTESIKRNLLIIILLPLLVSVSLLYLFLCRSQRALINQLKTLQATLQKEGTERAAIQKELEVQRQANKQVEEFYSLRKEEEQKFRLDLQQKRREEEDKLASELAEKRQKEEQKISSSQQPTAGHVESMLIKHQEERIMETLVDISPPERQEAWERIADQVLDLHTTSPEGALKFLRDLSKDENIWTRASIVPALARIETPPALDILFELGRDPHPEIQREVLRCLKGLHQNRNGSLSESDQQRISEFLQGEKTKGEWII